MSTTTWVEYQSLDEETSGFFQKEIVIEPSCVEQQLSVAEAGIDAITLDDKTQNVLLLSGIREKYTLVEGYAIPTLQNKDEILVKVIWTTIMSTFVKILLIG
jgi:hypothetical protein